MDVSKATAQLKDTIVFRREEDVPNMRAEMFPGFLERGDLYVGGFSPGGEPVLVRESADRSCHRCPAPRPRS